MTKEIRLLVKIIWILLGLLMIAYILSVSLKMRGKNQPEGDYIPFVDAAILLDAAAGREGTDFSKKENLTFGEFLELLDRTGLTSVQMQGDRSLSTEVLEELKKSYEKEYFILKSEFYSYYEKLIADLGLAESIKETNITIQGIGAAVKDEEGQNLKEDQLLTTEGIVSFLSPFFQDYPYQGIRVYEKEGTLLAVREVTSRGFQQKNIWIMEAADQALILFSNGFEITVPYEASEASVREQVADLDYADGLLATVKTKQEKVSGKLLSIQDQKVELEGKGLFPLQDEARFYQLFGKLQETDDKGLRIGYDFTDFVLEDGAICAGLITREEAMESIRVAIKTNDFAGAVHDGVRLTSDTDFLVRYNKGDEEVKEQYKSGDVLEIKSGDEKLSKGRVYVEPSALTGRIRLLSVNRTQGAPSYRGKLEISSTEGGLILVNELLLEEYLYSVVPSEMPASYPLEALKAQAVCARTYAYRNMLRSGLAKFGAHVDDSAGYQVYNNIAENMETTKAVKETAGELLYYGEELCGSYYYSTSCGFGTDTDIWKSENKEDTSYLSAVRIGEDTEIFDGKNMAEEGTFEYYISQVFEKDYEAEEPWYRWTYEVDSLDGDEMLGILKKRYEANPKLVKQKQKDGSFESEPVEKLGEIKGITIVERNEGGAADVLQIEGSKSTYQVISEHNIRYVLKNGNAKIIRKDESKVDTSSLLPSGYFVIDAQMDGKKVVGYKLTGGGYGHGVGMSQNGARSMAQKGFAFEEILTFFYRACEVRGIYGG